jgi:hypothetical protein
VLDNTGSMASLNKMTELKKAINARTRKACGEVRNAGIKVHTVRVIEGNAKLLRDCATSATDTHHEVRNAAELGPVFRRIANDIASTRLRSDDEKQGQRGGAERAASCVKLSPIATSAASRLPRSMIRRTPTRPRSFCMNIPR